MNKAFDDIELPRFVRQIGTTHRRVQEGLAETAGESISVLRPFIGLLNLRMEPGGGTFPTLSYLTLQPLVVEELSNDSEGSDRAGRPSNAVPDGTDTDRGLKVYQVLRNEAGEESSRSSAESLTDGIDRDFPVGRRIDSPRITDPPRMLVGRPNAEDEGKAIQGTNPSDEGLQLRTSDTGRPELPTDDRRNRNATTDRRTTLSDSDTTTMTVQREMTAVTNTTVRGERSDSPRESSGTEALGRREGGTEEGLDGEHDILPASERSSMAGVNTPSGAPAMTYQSNGSPREGDGHDGFDSAEHQDNRRESSSIEQRGKPPSSPSAESGSSTEVDLNRLADRLYRKLERKTQIERERRGL